MKMYNYLYLILFVLPIISVAQPIINDVNRDNIWEVGFYDPGGPDPSWGINHLNFNTYDTYF